MAREVNINSEQERKETFRNSVVVNRPPHTHSKKNNEASYSRMSPSYFVMRWVNSDRILLNAAVAGEKPPIITSSGRTFTI